MAIARLFLLEWLIIVTISQAQITPTFEKRGDIFPGDIELNITSIMLQNTLSWRPPINTNESDFKYTVWYRMKSPLIFPWETATKCVSLNDTKCDLNAGNNLQQTNNLYYLKVIATEDKTGIRYSSRILTFRPALDTVLLPPSFDVKYHGDHLFITFEKQEAVSRIDSLSYQVQYWKKNFENSKSNITIHIATSKEVAIKIDSDGTYCIRIQLFNEHLHENEENKRNTWSNVKCFKSGKHDSDMAAIGSTNEQNHNYLIIFSTIGLAAILTMLGVVYLSFRLWKIVKYVKKKEPLPEVLMLFHESREDSKYKEQEARHIETAEEVFSSALDYSAVQKVQQDERQQSCSTDSQDRLLNCGSSLVNANTKGGKLQNFYSGEEVLHHDRLARLQLRGEQNIPSTSSRVALINREVFAYGDFRQKYKDSAVENVTDFNELPMTYLNDNSWEASLDTSTQACANVTLMNITYSSDPARATPDLLYREYANNPMLKLT